MKSGTSQVKGRGAGEARTALAFTLIELLAVIGVIALLAALIVPLTALAVAKMKLAKARTELANLDMVIKSYKEYKDLGTYPPDNPASTSTNQLFYELSGTIHTPNTADDTLSTFTTISGGGGSFAILTSAQIDYWFNAKGFVNSTRDKNENPIFTHNFSPIQYSTNFGVTLLVCPVRKPNGDENPWNYTSGSFTNNNPDGFDLWVDVLLRGKTNRICNWSTKPVLL